MENKKKTPSTLKTYRRWKALKTTLHISTYTLPVIPAGVMVGLNWEEWIAQTGNGWSLGLGFGSLLVALIITIVGVAKKDKILSEKVSPLFYLAGALCIWAISFMFLASIMDEFGKMLLYTSFGLIGSASADQVAKVVIKPQVDFYKKLVEENGLDPRLVAKEKRRQAKIEKAKAEAKAEAEKEATD